MHTDAGADLMSRVLDLARPVRRFDPGRAVRPGSLAVASQSTGRWSATPRDPANPLHAKHEWTQKAASLASRCRACAAPFREGAWQAKHRRAKPPALGRANYLATRRCLAALLRRPPLLGRTTPQRLAAMCRSRHSPPKHIALLHSRLRLRQRVTE